MRIRYFCHYGQLTGYGRAARDYLAALAVHLRGRVNDRSRDAIDCADAFATSLQIDIIAYEDLHARADLPHARYTSQTPEPRYEHLDDFVVERVAFAELAPADVEIHHANPRLLAQVARGDTWAALELPAFAPARRRVALTTWETGTFPAEYAAAFRARNADGQRGFARIVVPSRYCAEVIDAADGPDGPGGPPIAVVPHCYDPAFWTLQPRWRQRDLEPTADTALPVRFYTVGAAGERKNIAGVVRAFLHAFSAADAASLMIVGGDPTEIRAICARSGIPATEQPAIHAVQGVLDEATLRELHGDADCYVSATRGEGWGLGLFEAAIMGRWIVTPMYGGHEDFLDPQVSLDVDAIDCPYPWLLDVDHSMTPCFGSEVRGEIQKDAQGRMFQSAKVAIPPGVTARQLWAEPDLAQVASGMRTVYEERLAQLRGGATPGLAARTAQALDDNAASFARRYGYEAVGAKLYHHLQEITES